MRDPVSYLIYAGYLVSAMLFLRSAARDDKKWRLRAPEIALALLLLAVAILLPFILDRSITSMAPSLKRMLSRWI